MMRKAVLCRACGKRKIKGKGFDLLVNGCIVGVCWDCYNAAYVRTNSLKRVMGLPRKRFNYYG